jgi:transcriptional regulator with XRE-family HTH domain
MPRDYPSTRGERIEVAIKGTGLTKGDFAAALGIHRQTVTRWCAGEDIAESDVERVAKLTGKSASWIRYGMVTSGQAEVDRYVEGYEQARSDVLEPIKRAVEEAERLPRPTPGDAKAPRQMRDAEERQEPLLRPSKRKRDREA